MSDVWQIRRARDEARAIQQLGYRQVHRDLNRRRSRLWRRLWMRWVRR